jgi:hypothetical protein
MSGDTRLCDLVRLTGAVREAEQAALRPIRAEEARLRAALARLTEQGRAFGAEDPKERARLIEAEIAWRSWAGQTRMRLNSELARVLVRKEARITALRRAVGKHEVAARLMRDAETRARRARDKVQEERLLGLAAGSDILPGDVDDQDFPHG